MLIDKVYLINLDESKERLKISDRELKKIGGIFADYTRISGINGNKLPDDYVKSITTPYSYYYLKNGRDTHYQMDTLGAIGCYLSHMKVWKDMIDNNYQNVIIFEDNFLLDNINKLINGLENLPSDTKIAYLSHFDLSLKKKINRINKFWYTTDNLYMITTKCYFLNIELAKKLYNKSLPIDTHVDFYINYYCINNKINRYYIYEEPFQIITGNSIIGHKISLKLLFINEIINPFFIIIIILLSIIFYLIKNNNKNYK
jgi:glycosyl transferase family 25